MKIRIEDVKKARGKREEKFEPAVERMTAVLAAIDYPDRADVRGRPGFVWYRGQGEGGNPGQAVNDRVANVPNLPVILQRTPPTGIWEVAQVQRNELNAHIQFDKRHAQEHQPGGNDPLYLYLRMLAPLRASANGDLTLSVASYNYYHGGEVVTFAAVPAFSVAASIPGAGLGRWALVYLDKATNSLDLADGPTSVPNPTLASYPDIPAASFPVVYVWLTSDTASIGERDLIDARLLTFGPHDVIYDAAGISYDNSASGLAAEDVQTAIDEVDEALDDHLADTDNPHGVTAAQAGALASSGAIVGSTSQAQSFGATGIKADVVAEATAAAGVTVDGVLLKDLDVFPNGDKIGLARRFINPLSLGAYTDHFRSGGIPSGYAWINPATGAGVTPSTLNYSLNGEFLYVSETTANQRDFLCKTAVSTYSGAQMYGRFTAAFQGEMGFRVDDADNPSTNFCELYLTGAPSGGLIRLDFRDNSATPTTGLTFPAGNMMIIRLYLLNGNQFFGYTYSEAIFSVNVFNSAVRTWPATAFAAGKLRFGIFYKNTGINGNPAVCDWFYTTFS